MNKDQKLISAIRFVLKKVLETGREEKCSMCECEALGMTFVFLDKLRIFGEHCMSSSTYK